ncbi:unnamed protein product [Orchesella dallaii]|uniref:Uncharacterized protein n=1 Tax=Orchesella dallaii TaxID=48710 RepID=A0ABP1R2A4_9HEXA
MRAKDGERWPPRIIMRAPSVILLCFLATCFLLLESTVAADDSEHYDYESLNPFQDLERIGRQAHQGRSQSGHSNAAKSSNTEDHHHHHHPKISRLDVSCSQQGIQVNVEFDSEFDGVIYSRGNFNDKKCRYLLQNC